MAFPNTPVPGLTGSGIVPGGVLGSQLAALTRRAVIPSVYTQIYQSHVALSMFMANAKPARGGISSITIPIQGASFVSFGWGSFAGDFALPEDQAAIQDARYDLKLGMVPIGFFGMEAIVQSSEVIIPKLRAQMSDAAVVMKQAYAQALYSNNYGQNLVWDSLSMAYDDGTNVPSYGGIARAGNQYWAGQLITNMPVAATSRVGMMQLLARVQAGAGGEAPDFAVMNPANWAVLAGDYMNLEMFTTKPKSIYEKDDVVNAGFRGISIMDTPIFPDPFCPLGSMFIVNSRYTGLYMSEYAPMTFSGFESQIPLGQISEIGVLISCSDLVCAKPSSGAQVQGITGVAWPNTPTSQPAVI